MIKRTAIILLAIFFIVLSARQSQAQVQVNVTAESAILINAENGQVLYAKNIDQKMYPASTTKVLTTLIAVEKGNLKDMVKVSRNACLAGGSMIGLQESELMSLEDLLYALMLASANDAAVAVAEHIGGSVESFAGMMNERAISLGAVNSNFRNPSGMPDPEHYTTCRDLASIAVAALQNDTVRRIAGTYQYRVERVLPQTVTGVPQVDFVTRNRLIWPVSQFSYKGATGMKTGYTDEARQCLVASAEREGRKVLAVILKAENYDVFRDAVALMDHGFQDFKREELVIAGSEIDRMPVKKGVEKEVAVVAAGDFWLDVPVADGPLIYRNPVVEENINAPVAKGQKLGELVLLSGDREVGRVGLEAADDVEQRTWFHWWFGVVILFILLMVVRMQNLRRRRRRYAARRMTWRQV